MIFKDICRFGLLSAFQKYIINLCTMKNKAVRVFLLEEGRIFEIFLSRGRWKRGDMYKEERILRYLHLQVAQVVYFYTVK